MSIMEILPLTPFPVHTLIAPDEDGFERLGIVVKATYDVRGGRAVAAEEQEPIRLADEYTGEPGKSGLLHAGEGALFKPETDVLLVGHAYAPKRGAREALVSLRVGSCSKALRVYGDRVWKRTLLTVHPGAPESFERIPLWWERAFGGVDDPLGAEARNPVGVGWRAPKSKRALEGTPAPNFEWSDEPIKDANSRPAPAGFGPVAPNWQPRLALAGTYDAAWLESQAPLLPADYDPAFAQVAPADQRLKEPLRGGEPVEVRNASPGGVLSCAVPKPDVTVTVAIGEERREVQLRMDTIVIDGDRERLTVVLRGSTPVQGRIYDVSWIRVGPAETAKGGA